MIWGYPDFRKPPYPQYIPTSLCRSIPFNTSILLWFLSFFNPTCTAPNVMLPPCFPEGSQFESKMRKVVWRLSSDLPQAYHLVVIESSPKLRGLFQVGFLLDDFRWWWIQMMKKAEVQNRISTQKNFVLTRQRKTLRDGWAAHYFFDFSTK